MERCPVCGVTALRKNGKIRVEKMTKDGLKSLHYQAYRCRKGHAFSDKATFSRATNSFIEYAVILYLRSLSLNTTINFLRLQYEKEILSKALLLAFIERVADRLPTLTDIDGLFRPKRSGYLALDGVYFKLAGELFCVLFCFDPETFDVIGYRIVPEENYENYLDLVLELRGKLDAGGVKVLGLYGDGEKGLLKALNEVWPKVPFQLCIVHKYLRMGQVIPFKSVNRKSVPPLRRRKILKFKRLFEATIFAKSKEESLRRFEDLDWFTKAHAIEKFYQGYRILRDNFPLTLTHYDHPHMERDNNLIECFNGIIRRKLNLFKGFKKETNIDRYLKLILLDYRFHKLVESHLAYRRKRSPLELAGVDVPLHYNFIKLLRETLNLNFEN